GWYSLTEESYPRHPGTSPMPILHRCSQLFDGTGAPPVVRAARVTANKRLTHTLTWSLLRAAMLVMVLFSAAGSASARDSLDALLTPYRDRYGLPALAAAVVKEGKVVAAGAVGTRRAGEQIPVTLNDRFHLGSDTKAMTALLAATFVEAGKLRWESTMADVFPELAAKMDSGLRRVTLVQFLSHTSGVPSDNAVFVD